MNAILLLFVLSSIGLWYGAYHCGATAEREKYRVEKGELQAEIYRLRAQVAKWVGKE